MVRQGRGGGGGSGYAASTCRDGSANRDKACERAGAAWRRTGNTVDNVDSNLYSRNRSTMIAANRRPRQVAATSKPISRRLRSSLQPFSVRALLCTGGSGGSETLHASRSGCHRWSVSRLGPLPLLAISPCPHSNGAKKLLQNDGCTFTFTFTYDSSTGYLL